MSPNTVEEMYDAVIIGAGAAGLSAALGFYRSEAVNELRERGVEPKVLVISKLQPLRSHTGSAEGGIAASLGNIEPDEWQWHYYDTVKGGDYLVDQPAAKLLAQYAPETVVNLERSGVAFSRTADGHIAQRRFGGHTKDYGGEPMERAAYAADRIGHQILMTLWQQCVNYGVQFAEEWYVSDLVLDDWHDSRAAAATESTAESSSGSGERRVEGVVAFDTHTGKTHAVHARNVLIATGGAGRLFHTTSNSYDLTGDGMALALDAGLQVEDVEFVQFHPTGLAHTGILLSEASRAEGGILRNGDGKAFMADYAPEHRDLAARDVVSRAIRAEVDAGRGVADPKDPDGPKDCVWLDMTGIDPEHMREVLPQVLETIEMYGGLDPTRDWVPVKPTAHYTMGGIPITVDGQVYTVTGDGDGVRTSPVTGLYAAGECSCVSVHGANRLGGNSLLDACLFGTRAGHTIAANVLADPVDNPMADDGADTGDDTDPVREAADARADDVRALLGTVTPGPENETAGEDDNVDNMGGTAAEESSDANAYQVMDRLGAVMDAALAVITDGDKIDRALAEVGELREQAAALASHMDAAAFNQEITAIWETRHLIELATAVLEATAARHESRGSLYRTDYPKRDDGHFLAHSMTGRDGDVDWKPVEIVDIEPRQRAY
ncbi:FAD-binding protein [Bifidobacterium choloepi]|uniref:succinate dehydrogenase n=1 Tax=Bifidobacterium choloepi TaxID=2614131 RepID=A0A6I5NCB0_9BIFI|nr:FAD-binding protein [Bifidobacterium choloepi]NEG70170.1 FAD-binding protein [Bifidobacterium choloepi]